MATNYQPLLDTPRSSSSCRRTLFVILSVATLISSTALLAVHFLRTSSSSDLSLQISQICDQAHDQTSCLALVSEVALNTSLETKNVGLLRAFLKKSAQHIVNAMKMAKDVKNRVNSPREQAAMEDCLELMGSSMERIVSSMAALRNPTAGSHADAHTWLSTVLTNHHTCLDGLTGSAARTLMEPWLNDLILRARTSLAIFVAVKPTDQTESINDELPSWVTRKDRRLLQSLAKDIKADLVVAKDGSGNYKTLKQAVDAAPSKSKTRYVIYVKKGTYKENVDIRKKNIMLVGDGMDATIITGSLNFVDGTTTFKSATVAAVGDGFIAQDMKFENTAGPEKHQAVALRVGADQSIINRCKIDAYQDTLYAHSNRQFYRDSFITGTIDFIFGNAAAVFQNCKIVARKPMKSQKNMVTAQGRTDPNQNTGTTIQKCEVKASSDLEPVKGSFKSYLGRPWKEYSRTVFMQSYIGDHIDPAGWSPWSGDFALKTLYYGEYLNSGPGAGTSKRVEWPGYHVITSPAEAKKFTVAELIQGGAWLKSAGVAYTEGL